MDRVSAETDCAKKPPSGSKNNTGIIGIIIPTPNISRKTVRNIVRKGDLVDFLFMA